MIEVRKSPMHENDSYLIELVNFFIHPETLKKIREHDKYLDLKLDMFANKDIDKKRFKPFEKDRLALRALKNVKNVEGSIYTHTVEGKNNVKYESIIESVRMLIVKKNKRQKFGTEQKDFFRFKNSRKMVVRVGDSFEDYLNAELGPSYKTDEKVKDVSCLQLIQYLENKVHLVFRASDIKNEIFPDIISIYEYFIAPVYERKPIDISIFSTTSQNVEHFIPTIYTLNKLFYKDEFKTDGYTKLFQKFIHEDDM